MDALDALATRGSARDYLPDAVSQDRLIQLIDAATHAPCAFNRQAWSFSVISDAALLDEMSREVKAFMTATRPLALPEHLYEKLADPDFHVFYRAPTLIVISSKAPPPAPWAEEDCALAAQNLMLAAHASGLGSCWIGLSQRFFATPTGRALLKLGADETPLAPIIVGRPRAPVVATPRAPADIRWIA